MRLAITITVFLGFSYVFTAKSEFLRRAGGVVPQWLDTMQESKTSSLQEPMPNIAQNHESSWRRLYSSPYGSCNTDVFEYQAGASMCTTTTTTVTTLTTTTMTATTVTSTATTLTTTTVTATTLTTTTITATTSTITTSTSTVTTLTTTTITATTVTSTATTLTTTTVTATTVTSTATTSTTTTVTATTLTTTTVTATTTTVTTSTSTTTTVTATTLTTTTVTATTLTTTTVTATTVTSTATTLTTTTVTATTLTTTTVTATTVTSTATTLTTTTVTVTTQTTSTTTTTTTTTPPGCATCPEYPLVGCEHIDRGATCTPEPMTSPCFTSGTPQLQCPANNAVLFGRPSLASGNYPQIKCMVCGIGATADGDARGLMYSGTVTFGQNQAEGQVNEANIASYHVYVSGDGDTKTKVATVPKSTAVPSNCCDPQAYSVDVQSVISPSAAKFVEVLPVDTSGVEMPRGLRKTLPTDHDTQCPPLIAYLAMEPEIDVCTTTVTTITTSTQTVTTSTVTTSTSTVTTMTTTTGTATTVTSTATTLTTTTVTATTVTSTATTLTTTTVTATTLTTTTVTATTTTVTATTLTTTTVTATTSTVTTSTSTTTTVTATTLTTTTVTATTLTTTTVTATTVTSTATTQTTTTVTATTLTTTTVTATTVTSTATTMTTSTVTATTLTTTTVTATTVTVTTTTTPIPCTTCGLSIMTGCSATLLPGTSCAPTFPSSPCIDSDQSLKLYCPSNNQMLGRAAIWSSSSRIPKIKCQVCDMTQLSADSDSRERFFTGTLSFGPNRIGDMIDETHVSEYKVVVVDSNRLVLGTVSTVAKKNVAVSNCGCNANEYSVSMDAFELPTNVAGVMIIVVDSEGVEMPIGHFKALVDDYETTTTSPAQGSGKRGIASSARRVVDMSRIGIATALMAFLAAIAL